MLDFFSIVLFRNSQEMCFYSCQITSLCSLFCNIMLIKNMFYNAYKKKYFMIKTFASVAEVNFLGVFVDDKDDDECLHLLLRPQLLRTLQFLFNTDGF